ncbi:transposable element Tc1 transposase [Trichonephila clavipes]|uniref:Transposable element Tc1 transposase n=1 Tax=Trichonephila clavipes TaxID=2585209 RepID=A0A8X6SDA2_TRICX|nr:transposable element Tc1 transposase [Trichonephila clavipes]
MYECMNENSKTVSFGYMMKHLKPNNPKEASCGLHRSFGCIPLTPRHNAARRKWAAKYRDWMQRDWSQVLFSDESRFVLECDTRHVLVWGEEGTRNNPIFVTERSHYRHCGLMI